MAKDYSLILEKTLTMCVLGSQRASPDGATEQQHRAHAICFYRPYSKTQKFCQSHESNGKRVVLPAQNLCPQQKCIFCFLSSLDHCLLSTVHCTTVTTIVMMAPQISSFSMMRKDTSHDKAVQNKVHTRTKTKVETRVQILTL